MSVRVCGLQPSIFTILLIEIENILKYVIIINLNRYLIYDKIENPLHITISNIFYEKQCFIKQKK